MNRTLATAIGFAAAAILILIPSAAQASGNYPTGQTGIDNSFPSCHDKRIPASTAAFGIVGVNGGSNYTQDPCAKSLASLFSGKAVPVSLYVNTGLYRGGSYFAQAMTTGNCGTNQGCGAFEDGYLAGQYAYKYATSQGLGLTATTWWLDVENTNTWDTDLSLNTQEIKGEYKALSDALMSTPGSTIGVYAVPSQWAGIVGNNWDKTNDAWPTWIANGLNNPSQATIQSYCTAPSVTGGTTNEIVQYVVNKQDYDYGC